MTNLEYLKAQSAEWLADKLAEIMDATAVRWRFIAPKE